MKYDRTYYNLFSNPEMVEDLLKSFVHEDWVDDLDFSTLELLNSKFISQEINKREGDLVFRIQTLDGKPRFLVILLEFQSTPDDLMAVRFMVYAGMLYQQLIKEGKAEAGKLPPIFPLVLYNGDQTWRSAKTL